MPAPGNGNTADNGIYSQTVSFAPGAGTNFLIAFVTFNGSAQDGAATYNGVSCSVHRRYYNANMVKEVVVFYIATSAGTTAQDFAVSGTNTASGIIIFGLSGVNTGTPFTGTGVDVDGSSGALASISATVGSTTNDLAFAGIYNAGGASFTPNAPTTVLDSALDVPHSIAVLQEAGAASVTLEATLSAASSFLGIAFSVQGSGGAPASKPYYYRNFVIGS